MTRQVQTVVKMRAEVEIQRAVSGTNIPGDEQFQLWVESALAGTEKQVRLTIRIAGEQEAWQFNRDYRHKDYATNVLSFPAELPDGLPAEIKDSQVGDILICEPVVAREAREQGREESDHWAHLTIHGVLHLLGFNHEQAEEASVMEALETEILAKLGISDPYRDISR